MPRRPALTHDRIVEAAARVADAGGLAQVSMRNVGRELGVEAMSLYHHVANKEALLDGLTSWIFAQVDLPEPDAPWRPAMAARAASARAVLSAHPWALGLVESRRSPGPPQLRYHDAVLGCLRGNGFSISLAVHAFSAIDSYVYGFVLTETNLPFDADEGAEGFVEEIGDLLDPAQYPHLVEVVTAQIAGGFAYGDEFEFGLDLVLDSVERHLRADPAPRRGGRSR
jgi:AcrR family transcriptional regulator